MSLGHLSGWIIAGVILLVGCFYWRMTHAHASFDPSQILRYYRRALETLFLNRWLVLLPVALYGFGFLLSFLPDIPRQIQYWEQTALVPVHPSLLLSPYIRMFSFKLIAEVLLLPSVLYACEKLEWVSSVCLEGYLSITVFLTCALAVRPLTRFLKERFGDSLAEQIAWLEKSLMWGLVVVPLGIVVSSILAAGKDSLMMRRLLADVGESVAGAFVTCTVAFAEAVYLSGVAQALRSRTSSPREILGKGLSVFPVMFGYQLVVVAILAGFMLIESAFFTDPKLTVFGYISWFTLRLGRPLLPALLFMVPFVIVQGNRSLKGAFREAADFFLYEFPNYLLFIISGIALIFVPRYIASIADRYLNSYFFIAFDVQLVFSCIQVVFATWFTVATFAWFLDSNARKANTESSL